MIIFDTSIFIDFIKGEKPILHLIRQSKIENFNISAVTLAEFGLGLYFIPYQLRNETQKKLQKFIEKKIINIFPVEEKVAFQYAKVQAGLRKRGMRLSHFDGVIAATTLLYNGTLVTADTDFKRVKGLKLLFPS
jgi:predicted nucleic acid-binding protein